MRVIHFIEQAHLTTVKFIIEITRLLKAESLVINQDPLSMKMWTLPHTDILVSKGLSLSARVIDDIRPDVVIDYSNSPDLCQHPRKLIVSTHLPDEGVLSTCMVDVKNIKKTEHYFDPELCKVMDLSDDDYDLKDHQLAVYVAPEGHHEPRRIIECMAAGIPVVANRTKDISQLVMNGVNGLVVSEDESIADAVKCLVEDPDTRHEMGQDAIHWVENTADIQVAVSAVRKLLNGRNTGNSR